MAGGSRILSHAVARICKHEKLNEIAQFVYLKTKLIMPVQIDRHDRLLFKSPPVQEGFTRNQAKVAFICDEMTWWDYSGCCNSIFLHPKVWKEQLRSFQPEILFCEATWSGIDAFGDVWRGRIYRDRRVSFENRDVLLEILHNCRERGITTVFWNKEDPAFCGHPVYDFTSTALLFDCIFTTDAGCIERYRKQGHQNVHLLPFGVNTALFYPAPKKQTDHSAFFAGSWYGDQPERCQALDSLLCYAMEQGWKLDIYDRKSMRPESRFRFPQQYTKYIRQAVPFQKMPDIYRQYQYGINVNTVVDSPTMLSRRVLQLAACGVTVVTNDATALELYRDCLKIWKNNENGPVFAEGIPEMIAGHSTESRFRQVLQIARTVKERTADYV